MAMQLIPLTLLEGEPRVDSRIVSYELGVAPRNTYELVDNYYKEFQEFGSLRFETEVINRKVGATQTKFYLLNEDQTYFLMTLVRNTPEAVALKKRLVKAFAQFRTAANNEAHEEAYGRLIDEKMVLLRWLAELKPEIGKITRFHRAGLNQREIARALGWGDKRVRRCVSRLKTAGLLPRPETRQLTLLEG